MIAILVWVSTCIYGLLALIWSKDGGLNFFIKAIFFALTLLCVVILYKENGFSGFPMK